MKLSQKLIVSIASAALLSGCFTSAGGENKVDLKTLHARLEGAKTSIGDIGLVLADTDPKLSAKIGEITALLSELDTAIETAIETDGGELEVVKAVDLFLEHSGPLVKIVTDDPETQAKVRLTVMAIRAIAVQVKISLEK